MFIFLIECKHKITRFAKLIKINHNIGGIFVHWYNIWSQEEFHKFVTPLHRPKTNLFECLQLKIALRSTIDIPWRYFFKSPAVKTNYTYSRKMSVDFWKFSEFLNLCNEYVDKKFRTCFTSFKTNRATNFLNTCPLLRIVFFWPK